MPAPERCLRRVSLSVSEPRAAVGENVATKLTLLDQERQDVAKNLSGCLEKTNETVLPRINAASALTNEYLADFLRATKLYSTPNERWIHIPEGLQDESRLRSSVMVIVATILARLTKTSTPTDGSTRSIVETWNTPLAHKPFSEARSSSPSLAVIATGPSFELPEAGDVGYKNIATCILVVTKKDEKSQEVPIFQLGVFAKQILYQQPNRDFVRLLYITEERVALVHFDRAGVQATQEVQYHLHPEALVCFVLAVSSSNEKELGFDSGVSWAIRDGRKVSGHISVLDANSHRTSYPMRLVEPAIAHSDIQSRGLRIWKATDPVTGKNVIIKDTWLFECQKPETEHLLRVRGIEGIVQMVALDVDAHQTTVEMRAEPATPRKERSRVNKVRYRMVLEEYGCGVAHFRDEQKVIEALRDGVAALQRMNQCGLIHRDVSPSNTLLGVEGAQPGWRGVVIDLDNAHAMDDSDERNASLGTRPYISLNVLRCRIDADFAARYLRDHLDDIESIFWILCRIAYGWKLPGCHIRMRRFMDFSHCDVTSFELKDAFFQANAIFDTSKVLSNFGAPTKRLLERFFCFLKEINQLKFAIDDIGDPGKQRQARLELADEIDAHYQRVLALFDKALSKLQAPPRNPLTAMKINFPSFMMR